ncbi:MAG: SUMF1/EgtB/PvdO family nonheme iron enzyme [Kiritimatiellae bacterium]|nr:SUMF1/EgtB/PvdO family nonheme iron enzyme [Kiritimatiellia bacterium]
MKNLIALTMALLAAVAFADAPEIRNVTARQRYPWNGKVDISFEIVGDLTNGVPAWNTPAFSLSATNCADGACWTAAADAVSGDTDTAEGLHHVVWDLDAQGLAFKSDEVAFAVTYAKPYPLYCVVDLSAGADADSYPMAVMDEPPSGGFNTSDYKTTRLVLRLIEPRSFKMGGTYDVTLTKPYYMGIFEVTQKQYELVTGDTPSYYKDDMRPVEYVSWNAIRGSNYWPTVRAVAADSFAGRLQARTGLNFDLPTEAQWEYACRAGTTSDYNNGTNSASTLDLLGRYSGNQSDGRGGFTNAHTTVGSYLPNAWGLYDMHGNVWEWCLDWYDYSLSGDVPDPEGPTSGTRRVIRGGSWQNLANLCKSSNRERYVDPKSASFIYGFRLARHVSDAEEGPVAGMGRAGVVCAAETAPVAIDSRSGVRDSDGQEKLAYSSWWDGDASATVTIAEDGVVLAEGLSGEGDFTWNATHSGTCVLTHTTYTNGVEAKVETAEFSISAQTIAFARVDVDCSEVTYRGTAYEPVPLSVTLDGQPLVAGTDYTLAYSDNVDVGTATLTLTGINLYRGTYATNFTIVAKALTAEMVAPVPDAVYTGAPLTPEPEVTDAARGVVLAKDVDYTLSYADNTEIGTATVTVTGTGNYTGSVAMDFAIRSIEDAKLRRAIGNLPAAIAPNGEGGWTVTLTNEVNGADLPIEFPDNLGAVTVDLNGHDLVGDDGEPAIRVVADEGDGEPTQLTVATAGGDATVQGGAGAPAIEVADDAQDGVLINIGEGVTVRGGGDDVVAIIGTVGTNNGTIVLPVVKADVTLTAGVYFKRTLVELGYDVPTNGTPYSVTAKGLPSGLALKYNAAVKNKKGKVTKPAKVEWWIEGVPTAALDYATNPPYLVITTNGVTETLPLSVGVLAQEVVVLDDLALGQALKKPFYLPGVTNGWAVSGLPTGLKYTAKLVTTKKKVGKKTVVTTNALPYSVYGKTSKAGLFTITAKKKKGAYYETMKYRVLVKPKDVDAARFGDSLTNLTTMAYEPFMWDLSADVSAEGGKVAKVTGLPAGLSFVRQMIAGKPTKTGTYVVTFTKNVKSGTKTVAKTAQILWRVVANEAEVSLGFNEAGGVVESGVVGLRYGDLLAFGATEGATVKASGLPAGISLARLDGAAWGFKGYTTKAGAYLVTVTATLNGKTAKQRIALKVDGLPAWAKGTYNGYVRGSGTLAASTNGLATVTVGATGKISGKFQELGTNWTLSAACYTARSANAPDAFTCTNVVATYSYKVKSGKKTVTKKITRAFTFTVSPVPVVPDVPDAPVRGVITMREDAARSASAPYQEDIPVTEIQAWQNVWGRAEYKARGKWLFTTKSGKKTLAYKVFTFKGTTDEGAELGLDEKMTLSLKVTTAGPVTATLSFDTGKTKKDPKTKKTEKVIYKATCSTAVIPTAPADANPFTGEAFLYFAPSPGNGFGGLAGWVPLP